MMMTLSKLTDKSTQNGQSELASKVGMTLETAVRALYWLGFILPSIKAISDSYHISLKTSAVYAAFGHPPSPWHYMWHEQYKLCAMTYKICLFRTAEMDSLTSLPFAPRKKKGKRPEHLVPYSVRTIITTRTFNYCEILKPPSIRT